MSSNPKENKCACKGEYPNFEVHTKISCYTPNVGVLTPPPVTPQSAREDEDEMYCKTCGGCGYVGCCGVRSFLKKHVEGKTNCLNEAVFISEIIGNIYENSELLHAQQPTSTQPLTPTGASPLPEQQ